MRDPINMNIVSLKYLLVTNIYTLIIVFITLQICWNMWTNILHVFLKLECTTCLKLIKTSK